MGDARGRVLDAFEAILIERGDRSATLDAVAEEAGVSKGGLIYHFPTRDALVGAFLERAAEAWDRRLREALEQGCSVADFYLSSVSEADAALVRAVLSLPRGELEHGQTSRTLRALLAGWSERLRAEADDDPVQAEIVRLVGDGLLLNALIGQTPEAGLLDGVRARVLPGGGP